MTAVNLGELSGVFPGRLALATEWGSNPESLGAVATAIAGLIVVVTTILILFQLRQGRKAREADVLLKLLEQFAADFLPGDAYQRLVEQARALAEAGKAKDWSQPLDDDEVQLVKLIKLYGVAGSLLSKRMIRRDPLLRFICEPLRHHYRDFGPFIASSASRDAVDALEEMCRSRS